MREFLINKAPLEGAIKTLQPFVTKEDYRPNLNGIFFEWKAGDEKINLVATDGHKLCVLQLKIDPAEDCQGDIAAIVPLDALKTILTILKSIENGEMPLTMKFSDDDRTLWIDCLDQKGEFKLIDGTFPDYRRVIPAGEPKFTIGFQKEQAAEALKAVAKHKAKEPMEWQITDAMSPLKLVGEDKIVVVMPCRTVFEEIALVEAA